MKGGEGEGSSTQTYYAHTPPPPSAARLCTAAVSQALSLLRLERPSNDDREEEGLSKRQKERDSYHIVFTKYHDAL